MTTPTPAQPAAFSAGTLLHTDHGLIPAARLARMRNPPQLVAFNHIRARYEHQPILAWRSAQTHRVRELRTETGRSLWCTDAQAVYVVGRGYVPAATVRPGSEVIAAAEPAPPLRDRAFKLPQPDPAGRFEETRPTMTPPGSTPGPTAELPLRRRDWIRGNRIRNSRSIRTCYQFSVSRCYNLVADGILIHNGPPVG